MKTIAILLLTLFLVNIRAFNQDTIFEKLPDGIAPIIDGTIDGLWDSLDVHYVNKNFVNELPTLTATWKAAWNDTALFVIVSVNDDYHCDSWCSGDADWNSDKVEVYIDVNDILKDGKGPQQQPNGTYQFAPGFDSAVSQVAHSGYTWQGWYFTYAYKINDPDYIFEYAIPCNTLKDKNNNLFLASVGKQIGFDVCVVDRDSANDTRRRSVWKNTGGTDGSTESYNNMDSSGIVALATYHSPTLKLASPLGNFTTGSTYNLGQAALNLTKEVDFILKNEGQQDLNISSIDVTGSGFSVIQPSKTVLVLNDTLKLRVFFQNNVVGDYTGSIQITSNDTTNGTYTINLKASAISAAVINGGDVYGTWTKDNSPYFIFGDISIPKDSLLTIEAGVKVVFLGYYSINVIGSLKATGTNADSIYFTKSVTDTVGLNDNSTSEGAWNGITWDNSGNQLSNSDSSIFKYCIFQYSKTIYHAGGAINIVSFDKVKFYNCVFNMNGSKNDGGAIFLNASGYISLNQCTFSNNSTLEKGGALSYQWSGGTKSTITNCSFYNNKAGNYGGALYLSQVKTNLLITKCSFIQNKALEGGAIYTDIGTTPLYINYCDFLKNTSLNKGAAIFFNFGGVDMQNCMIANNYAKEDGALFFSTSDDFIGNCIIANNRSDGQAAIIIANSSPVFANNTITNNSGTYSGIAFWDNSVAEFYNNIIWGNTNSQLCLWQAQQAPVFKNCDIQPGQIYHFAVAEQNAVFSDTIGVDPQFISPTDSADLTLDASVADWRINSVPVSAVINRGISNDQTIKLLTFDYYNQPRIRNGIIDMGASETYIRKITVEDTIKVNTIWVADTAEITHNVVVKDSATLTLSPGIKVLFDGPYEIQVAGTIKAISVKDNPIVFTMNPNDTTDFNNLSLPGGGWQSIDFNNEPHFGSGKVNGADGAMSNNDTSFFSNCIFEYAKNISNGVASNVFGGAMNVRFFSRLVISECIFRYNIGVNGGAIYISNQSSPIIKNCIFHNNYASDQGGAIACLAETKPYLINNLITSNYAITGGGVELKKSNAILMNNIVSYNVAYWGAGVCNHYFGRPLLVNNTIVYNNSLADGGGLQNWDAASDIYNTVFWGNHANNGTNEISTDQYGVNLYNCNIEKFNLDRNYSGAWNDTANIISVDPAFINVPAFENNNGSGLTADYNISVLSGNIDKGINNISGFIMPSTDFFGKQRINNGLIDIGAFENQGKALEIISQPIHQKVCEKDTVILSFKVKGLVKYQWMKNGNIIPGATDSIYIMNSITKDQEASYSCIVANSYGSFETNNIYVTVQTVPFILVQPKDHEVCKGDKTEFEISVTGAVPIYYQWYKNNELISDAVNYDLLIDSALLADLGSYYCIVSNICGDTSSKTAALIVHDLPIVDLGNDTSVCWNTGFTLDPGDYELYRWNDFTTDRFKSTKETGDYFVKVTDLNGCKNTSDTVHIIVSKPEKPELFMVTVDNDTVDSSRTHNMILWEKKAGKGITAYNIYKESVVANLYGLIGSVPFEDTNRFIDTNSDPRVKADRYKISAVDTCGNESELSDFHKTIHLTINVGAGAQGGNNLMWNYYEGFSFDTYYLYRGKNKGNMVKMDSIQSNLNSYSDLHPPDGDLYYMIAFNRGDTLYLTATEKASSGPFMRSTSNIEDNRIRGTEVIHYAPTDIFLSNTIINEKLPVGTTIGSLSSADKDTVDQFTYALFDGDGGIDNSSFYIENNLLKSNVIFDFNVKTTFGIRIQSSDNYGFTFEKSFVINVNRQTQGNHAPTDIFLTNNSIDENKAVNSTIGNFSSQDQDASDSHTYQLVSGSGSTDNAQFVISTVVLKSNAVFDYETKDMYYIRVRSTDPGGLYTEKPWIININDRPETSTNHAPTNITLTNNNITENNAINTLIGILTVTDQDAGDQSICKFVSGSGDTDNSSFVISNNVLYSNKKFDYETKNSYSIRIKATDKGGLNTEKSFTVHVIKQPTGIEEYTSGNLIVYPNPFSDYTTIELKNGQQISGIELFTISGVKIMEERNINNTRYIVQRKDLKPGMYYVKIYSDQVYTTKLIIK